MKPLEKINTLQYSGLYDTIHLLEQLLGEIPKETVGYELLKSKVISKSNDLKSMLDIEVESNEQIYSIFDSKCEYYGDVGEYIGYGNYHVGDLVKTKINTIGCVVKKHGQYFVYGWKGLSFEEMEISDKIRLRPYIKYNKYQHSDFKLPLYIKLNYK
jgi:hypothetical protein